MSFQCRKNLRLRRLLLGVLHILFFAFSAQGQFRFDHWTTDDGLPQNSVYSIVQTTDGYLWIVTLDGLVRFDGVKFKVFNKSNSPNFNNNRLQNVYADGDTLWIAPENSGLVRYLNGEFKTFTTADGLPSNNVYGVHGSDVIIGSNNAEVIDGGNGDDRICGFGGADPH